MVDIRTQEGEIRLSLPILIDSKRVCTLMGDDYIILKFATRKKVSFALGDYINHEVFGWFELTEAPSPTYNREQHVYNYDLKFNAHYKKWGNKILKYDPESQFPQTSFSDTLTLSRHASLIVRNLFTLGYVNPTDNKPFVTDCVTYTSDVKKKDEAKNLTFQNADILSAISQIAQAYETEWWVSGNVLYFGKCMRNSASPVEFEIGNNISTIAQAKGVNSEIGTRFYIYGSNKNISQSYRKNLYFEASAPIANSLTEGLYDVSRPIYPNYIRENGPGLDFKFQIKSNVITKGSDGNSADCISVLNVRKCFKVTADTAIPIKFNFSELSKLELEFTDQLRCVQSNNGQGESDTVEFITKHKYAPTQLSANIQFTCYAENPFVGCSVLDSGEVSGGVFNTNISPLYNNKIAIKKEELTDSCNKKTAFEMLKEKEDFFTLYTTTNKQNTETQYVVIEFQIFAYKQSKAYNPDDFRCESVEVVKTEVSVANVEGAIVFHQNIQPDELNVGVSVLDVTGQVKNTYSGYLKTTESPYKIYLNNAIVEKGCRYRINNIDEYAVPPSYYVRTLSAENSANITNRLMLPSSMSPYIDLYENLQPSEIIEKVLVFEEVYPKVELEVIDVVVSEKTTEDNSGKPRSVTWYDVRLKYYNQDKTAPPEEFTFNAKYKLPGAKLHMVFQSGLLNGMDFECDLNKFDANEHGTLAIIPNETYGRELPDTILLPKVGDRLLLYNWNSQSKGFERVVQQAEMVLLAEAQKYIKDMCRDASSYPCEMMSDYMFALGKERDGWRFPFNLGDAVNLKNEVYFGDTPRMSRVLGYECDLDKPYNNPTITLGDKPTSTRSGEIKKTVESLSLRVDGVEGVVEQGVGITIIGKKDGSLPSDDTVYSSLRSQSEFLSKKESERTEYNLSVGGELSADKSLKVGNYVPNVSGATMAMDANTGQSFVEVDNLLVRAHAYFETLTTIKSESLGGRLYITPGGSVECVRVEEIENEYLCFFLVENNGDSTAPMFKEGDLAICKRFDNDSTGYWRKVLRMESSAISDDKGNTYGLLALSKTDCEGGSAIPSKGDTICQFGSTSNDTARQSAIVISSVGTSSPYITLYSGIDSFSVVGKDIISYGYDATKGQAYLNSYGSMYFGDKSSEKRSYISYDPTNKEMSIKGRFIVGDENREITVLLNAIEQSVNSVRTDVNGLNYLKSALTEGETAIQGGLVMTSHIAMVDNGSITAGINGKIDTELGTKSIASWWGGACVDRFDSKGKLKASVPENAARGLVRMDGSGYFANGAIKWDKFGAMTFGSGIAIEGGGGASDTSLGTISSLVSMFNDFQNLIYPVDINGNRINSWQDQKIHAIRVAKGLFSDSFISANGMNDMAIEGGSGSSGGTEGGSFSLLQNWDYYNPVLGNTLALSAELGYGLKELIEDVAQAQTSMQEHTHKITDVTGLTASLDSKASKVHHHDDTYLGKTAQSEDSKKLGGKLPSYYAISSDVINLTSRVSGIQTTLDGKLSSINKSMVESVLTGSITSHTHPFSSITATPNSLSGYGINDAYTQTEINNRLSTKTDVTAFDALKRKIEDAFIFDGVNVLVKGGLSATTYISATGTNTTGGGGVGSINILQSWDNYKNETKGYAITAELVQGLRNDTYTKAYVDELLVTKSDIDHNHDSSYLAKTAQATDSAKFDGLTKSEFMPKSAFGYQNGHLVVLDIPRDNNCMVNVRIMGQSYDNTGVPTFLPIDTILQFYSYHNASNPTNPYYLYSHTGVNHGSVIREVKLMHLNGKVALWFKTPYDRSAQSVSVYAWSTYYQGFTEKADGRNLIESISNANAPTDGVTLERSFYLANASFDGHNHDSLYSPLTHNHDSQYLGIGATALDSFKLGGNPASDFFRNFGYDNSNPNELGDFNNKNGVYLISDVAVNWTEPFKYGSVLNISNNVASWQIGVSSTAGAHPYFRSRWWSGRSGGSPWGNWEQLAFVSDVNKKVDTTTFNAFKTGAESSLNTLESKRVEHENTANNRFKAIEDYLTILKGAISINGINVSVTGGLSANTYVSAGGVNTEGSGGAGGNVNILQNWENYRAETENYATTAKLLYDVKSVSEAGIADLRTDVTGLRASKADKHDHPYAPTSHGHTWGEITGIPTEFIPKAHVHAIKDVTGLQTALDGKSNSSHVHTIANVTGLQGALDGKSSTGHNHDSAYLGKTAQAVDADKLDGKHASEFVDLASSNQIVSGSKYFQHAMLNVSDNIHTHMNVLISTNTAMEENEKGRVWRLLHTYKDGSETDNARGLNFYAYTNGSNGATHVARLTAHNDMPEFIVPYGRIKASRIEINGGTSNHILLGDGTTLNRATLATASDLNSGLALKLDKSAWETFQIAFNKAFTLNDDGSVTAKIGLSSEGYISALGSNTTIGGVGGGNTYERLDNWTDYQEGQVLSAKLGKETYDQLQSLSDSVNVSLGDRYTKAEVDGKYVAKEANKRLMTNAEGTKLAGLSNYTHPSSHSISEVSGLQDTINTINTALSNAVTKNTSQTISAPKYFDSHMLFVQSARTDYQQIISSTLDVIPNDAIDKKWALHHMYYSKNSSARGLSIYSYDATGKSNRVAKFKSHDENSFYVYGVIQANKYKLPEGTDNQILLGSGAILDRTTLATKSDVALKLDKSVYDTHVTDYNAHKSAWSSFQTTYNTHVSDYGSFKSNTNTRLTTLEGHHHDTQYLGINAQAKDSAKLGGNLPSYFATHSDMVAHKSAWDAFKSAFDKAFVLNSDGSVKAKVGLSSDGYLSALGVSTETGETGAGYVRLDDWNNYSEEQVLSAKLGKETHDAVQGLLTWKSTDFVDFHVSVNTALANRYTKTESDARYVAKETGKGLMTDAERTKLSGIATNANNYVHPAKHSISEITDLQTMLDGKSVKGHNHDTAYSPLGHNHNDAYYTKSESDNLLSSKSDKTHNHNTVYSPLGHTHDNRYYTETEIDAKLGTKANNVHRHQQSEVEGLNDALGEKSNIGHTHDDRYFTEEEMSGVLDAHLTQIENLELTIMEQQGQIDALKAQLESVLSVLNISGNSINIKGSITAQGSISSLESVLDSPSTSGLIGATDATPQPTV